MSEWYCIYTKPKQENSICERLISFTDIECLNPKIKVEKAIRGRTSQVVEALFPRYIFLKMNVNEHYHVIKNTRGVKSILGDQAGQPKSLDTELIDVIRQTVERGQVSKKETQFAKGDRVIITNGIFGEFEATVLKDLRANDRVLIMLNAVYQARLEISRNLLSKI